MLSIKTDSVISSTGLGGVSHFESVNEKSVQWNKLNSLRTAIYVSEQVCIGWHITGAYYTARLTFFHDFLVKVWGAYYKAVRTVLYSNFYGTCSTGCLCFFNHK